MNETNKEMNQESEQSGIGLKSFFRLFLSKIGAFQGVRWI